MWTRVVLRSHTCPRRHGCRVNTGFSLVDQGACPTRSDKGFDTISKNRDVTGPRSTKGDAGWYFIGNQLTAFGFRSDASLLTGCATRRQLSGNPQNAS